MTTHERVERSTDTRRFGFRKVVVGIDGSPESHEAARQALRLAGDDVVADLVTAYVTVTPLVGMTGAEAPVYLDEDRLRELAERTVGGAVAAVGEHARGYARAGVAWDVLIDAADGAPGGLVAVASHGTGRFAGILVGSVATEVIHKSLASVLVARDSGPAFPERIVVGVDGSESSRAAFAVAAGLAARHGATLLPVVAHGGKHVDTAQAAAIVGRRYDDYEDAPAHALVAAAAGCDLLVVGSRGLHGIRALGSVSERVAHAAPCSVLIVRNAGV